MGGSGDKGVSGGKGGSSGDVARKNRHSLESPKEVEARLMTSREKYAEPCPEEVEARLRTRREKYAEPCPEDKGARFRARREKYGGAMTVQAATHLLITIIFGVDPQDESLLREQKWEIDKFLDAV